MNGIPNHTGDLIDTYVGALAADDAETALTTLSADAAFHSPFRTWRSRHVPSVFRARASAFSNLLVKSVIRDHDRAVILWQATVSDAHVEAAELVSISDGAICRVDVFLRPATVLDTVYQAMVTAWPRGPEEEERRDGRVALGARCCRDLLVMAFGTRAGGYPR